MHWQKPLLAFDTGSPVVSVALALPDRVATLTAPQGRSSRELIAMIDELLTGAGLDVRELGGIGAARGPGSFTGLRVGLATALGLHQAAGAPAGAVPTFEILAAHYAGNAAEPAPAVRAAVDAHRDRWFAQAVRLAPGGAIREESPPEVLSRADLEQSDLPVVGHGVASLAVPAGAVEAADLAPTLLRRMADGGLAWDASTLVEPLYLRPPATSAPRRAPGSPRPGRRRGAGRSPLVREPG